MNAKKWSFVFFTTIFSISIPIALLNYFIDPLWTFSHTNFFNAKQRDFNERHQKSNYLFFNRMQNYNGILLGSSRSTFIQQTDFKGMDIFNYAMNSMWPFEYEHYINFAKNIKGKDLDYIIIGADFYGTMNPIDLNFKEPAYYLTQTQSSFYRYKMLFNLDILQQSLKTIKLNILNKSKIFYDRNVIKYQLTVNNSEFIKRYTTNIIRHTSTFTDSKYVYNNNYIDILKKIKSQNPNSKFIVFTSPISADLFASIMLYTNRLNEYHQWLNNLIDIFGEVYCFMGINSITINLNNYPDDDHFYPYIGGYIANKLSLYPNEQIPNDFGILLNKSNITYYINEQKKYLQHYSFSSFFPEKELKLELIKLKYLTKKEF